MRPVLVIVFNRPRETKLLLESLAKVQPAVLYVAADGPRLDHQQDRINCPQVRELFDKLSWKCEVHKLFREDNLGCKRAVSSAITWFFENVDAGIILEDDCIPDTTFFDFCSHLLDRYANDLRIGHIGGFNCQLGRQRGEHSYYFSRYYHVWGWATWRRAWQLYDVEMKDYADFLRTDGPRSAFFEPEIREFWLESFEKVFSGKLDTWDYQWVYTNIKNNMLSVIPNVNLVQNVGFNEDATHTQLDTGGISKITAGQFALDEGPRFFVNNVDADRFTYTNHIGLSLRPEQEAVSQRRRRRSPKDWFLDCMHRFKMAIKAWFGIKG